MKPNRILSSAALIAGLVAISPLMLAGCDDKGPAEQVGEDIDEAANDAKRAIEDATD